MNKQIELINLIKNSLDQIGLYYNDLQKRSGLNCLESCGRCCENPNIYCRPSELLPMAFELYQKGHAQKVLESLEAPSPEILKDQLCIHFQRGANPGEGMCSMYNFRPLVCRSFGVYLHKNKRAENEFSVCKFIKEDQNSQYLKLVENLEAFLQDRILESVANEFYNIDPIFLTETEEQINLSLIKALKRVIFYFTYLEKNHGDS